MTSYILPGMGADSLMYGTAFRKLDGVKYLDWPLYKNEKSISEIASRIITENNIQSSDIVGGSSLGGIVAAEIAKQINIKKLILIGNTLTPENINPILKKFHKLSAITPVNLIQIFAGKANLLSENTLLKMFSKSDSSFIKAMCQAIFVWEGNEKPKCPVAHIHGANDQVIHPPSSGAEIISDGGHLIAITHEDEVAKFIDENIDS